MKKALYVLLVIALVGIGYALTKTANAPVMPADDTVVGGDTSMNGSSSAATPAPAANGKKMAFESFLKNDNGAYTCTVKQIMSDMDNSGTVYIDSSADMSKRRIRGEFSTISEGRKMDSTFIMRDGFFYAWDASMPKSGFKTALPKESADGKTSGTYVWDASQIGDYDCKAWTVDESKFALPSGTTFAEVKR